MAKPSLVKRWWYVFCWVVVRCALTIGFRLRAKNRKHVPKEGGAMLCSNHQSHLDPMLVGTSLHRRANYLARKTLLDIPVFDRLMLSLDAIPIDRDGLGLSGIKETLRRLRANELVLMFPEGTRSSDGKVAPLKSGICALARRGRCPLVPIGIAGAYEAWPRHHKLPYPGRVRVVFGEPISVEQIAELSDEELLVELTQQMQKCQEAAQQWRDNGKLPAE